jgi:1,4-alpha-glucan branching enzyme
VYGEKSKKIFPETQDLGVTAVEVMPLSNVGGVVDWG